MMARKSEDDILRDASSLWVEKYHFERTDDDIRDMRRGDRQGAALPGAVLRKRGATLSRRAEGASHRRDVPRSQLLRERRSRSDAPCAREICRAGERELRPSRYSCKAVGRAPGDRAGLAGATAHAQLPPRGGGRGSDRAGRLRASQSPETREIPVLGGRKPKPMASWRSSRKSALMSTAATAWRHSQGASSVPE